MTLFYLPHSLMALTVKSLPAMWETWVPSLGQEDPLEKGMATHSSIPAWEIPWAEEPGGLQPMGSQRIGHDLVTKQQHLLDLTLPDYPQWVQQYFQVALTITQAD